LAVEREIEEEAGVTAKVTDVVAFRHMLGGPSSNIYMIFRLDYVAGEPRYDSVETADAGFYSLDEMATMHGVQNISRWGIEQAILTIPGSGLTLDTTGTRMPRWQVFGLTDADPEVWRQH
jgi:NADH pyrophosphatase NudC (nudix superfamily)